MPNCALPSILACRSMRGAAVPISDHCFGDFTITSPEGVAAAALANRP